ncbi:acyl-CoA dehydrogenase family protein [Virgisporangium aurantiacum]|uniref:Acyl-CoA dehydrogenase n=1 Tax=Virgisporangium aurantiacum TaxID=175570 RepID=A0A8J4E6F8_9ACTN|nr:acyl-CoA dehydrogenase family protein [Virgisporangium aurantiacum]GIJ63189.1 acyl-CoA dehydrogenase [Virgisporangium aurantiacum]
MSTLQLNDEQRALAAAIRDFSRKECGTREQRAAWTNDFKDNHSPELYQRIADLGWVGVTVPAEYGGAGSSMLDMCVVVEECMRGGLPVVGIATTIIVAAAYERYGSAQQKKEMLGGIVGGAPESVAMSEPGAGSDVGSLSCRAVRDGDGWVVNGQKTWCSGAHYAKHILLVARTGRGATKHEGLTMFRVPTGTPGMEIRGIDTLGGREVNDIFFTDCRLPADAVVGTVDAGWSQLTTGLNVERLVLAAVLLGIAERAFDDVLAYVKQREQFGRPIGTFQALRHRIADLATELECCRLLTYHVAQRVDADPHRILPQEVSMAKLKVTETAKRVTLEGMQMMGGYGYASEYDMERHVRSALAGTIYGGSSEIQRDIIGKTLGL